MFLNRLRFFFTFGSIFGSILESFWEPSSSLYSFWSSGWPKQAHKKEKKKRGKKVIFWGRQGGRAPYGERGVPGMCLLTFGLKTELSLQRGAFSGFPEYLFRWKNWLKSDLSKIPDFFFTGIFKIRIFFYPDFRFRIFFSGTEVKTTRTACQRHGGGYVYIYI